MRQAAIRQKSQPVIHVKYGGATFELIYSERTLLAVLLLADLEGYNLLPMLSTETVAALKALAEPQLDHLKYLVKAS